MHIKRLGVVLIEISTGAAVADIQDNEEPENIKIVLSLSENSTEETLACSIEDVAASGGTFCRC